MTRLFVRFSKYTFDEVKEIVENNKKHELYDIVTVIAKYMSKCLVEERLELKPIHYSTRIDGMSKKERIIGVQEPLHQMFDYVAVEGLRQLFDAKIGVFQCASLPKKGQSYGKKYIEKWIKEHKTVYFVKGDIKKCFPSIPLENLKKLLLRDVKNEQLLWLVYKLIDMFEDSLRTLVTLVMS